MAQLILMRHAESIRNAQGIFAGSADVALSEVGKEQAKAARETIGLCDIDLAFASQLRRTRDTLHIAIRHHSQYNRIEIKTLDLLNERNFGKLEGEPKGKTIERIGVDRFRQWRLGMAEPPEVLQIERFENLRKRTALFAKNWAFPALLSGKNVLVVGHSQWLLAFFLELNPKNWQPSDMDQLPNAVPFIMDCGSSDNLTYRGSIQP